MGAVNGALGLEGQGRADRGTGNDADDDDDDADAQLPIPHSNKQTLLQVLCLAKLANEGVLYSSHTIFLR